MRHPKLRDSRRLITQEPYLLNQFPQENIIKIGAKIVYLLHIGRCDISGDDWGDIFAKSVNGHHLASPLGIADVEKDKMAWSVKTVKSTNAMKCTKIRLISGRCSPDFSFGIENPHEDIQRTGQAVLAVWNERINIAYDYYNPVRTAVLVRNNDLSEFLLFEENIERFKTSDYVWEENRNGNLLGVSKISGEVKFTWQPHGSQFTIHTKVPDDAVRFKVKHPPIIPVDEALKHLGFDESWITIL